MTTVFIELKTREVFAIHVYSKVEVNAEEYIKDLIKKGVVYENVVQNA
jgi:hypothetical protein